MEARVVGTADPFATAGRRNSGKILTCCRAHLLELIQCVRPRFFEERSPLLSHLDRIGEFYGAGDVWHVTNHFQWWAVTSSPFEIEAKSFGQLQLRYAQVVLGSNQLRNLIVQLHIRLQHVKPRN